MAKDDEEKLVVERPDDIEKRIKAKEAEVRVLKRLLRVSKDHYGADE